MKKLLPLIPMIFLGGCMDADVKDLQQFVAKTDARKPGKVVEIPAIKEFDLVSYMPMQRRSPFSEIVDKAKEQALREAMASGPRPDENRVRGKLEEYPLDTLRMVGVMQQRGTTWGLVKSPDGEIHRVTDGIYMGQNHGKIKRITESNIELTELIKVDQLYQEQQASLALNIAATSEAKK